MLRYTTLCNAALRCACTRNTARSVHDLARREDAGHFNVLHLRTPAVAGKLAGVRVVEDAGMRVKAAKIVQHDQAAWDAATKKKQAAEA